MKVKELVKKLKNIDPEMELIIQKYSEDNDEYSPLSGINTNTIYIPDTSYNGDVFDSRRGVPDANMSEQEWEEIKTRKCCIVLYPMN